MARAYNAIDADGHILEPPDLWDKYIDPEFRERRPQFTIDENGAAANAWLPGFITAYNSRFGRDPANAKDLHRPLAQTDDLDEILAWREERTATGEKPGPLGEREGSTPEAWEGEVGSTANHLICPPSPCPLPRPAGRRGRGNDREGFFAHSTMICPYIHG